MQGLIFAAGLGTRLRPLTNDRPKALVEVAGVPMLDRVARRLVDAGCTHLVVNVHHFAQRMQEHLARVDFGVPVSVSLEAEAPLETGGGLLHARPLLDGAEVVLIHNVDVWTDLPLERIVAAHTATHAAVTLAVAQRETSRYLRFDSDGLLGRADHRTDFVSDARTPVGDVYERAFNGVHVLSPERLGAISETGCFSILELYLRWVSEGHALAPYFMDDWHWSDIGSLTRLDALHEYLS